MQLYGRLLWIGVSQCCVSKHKCSTWLTKEFQTSWERPHSGQLWVSADVIWPYRAMVQNSKHFFFSSLCFWHYLSFFSFYWILIVIKYLFLASSQHHTMMQCLSFSFRASYKQQERISSNSHRRPLAPSCHHWSYYCPLFSTSQSQYIRRILGLCFHLTLK